ncbi:hypothetical protein [Actinoplanes sp. NPDC051851]|uniref:hypothetical protein n=1 Tax=Actinoplanes sp. NPDC051851 TaxID=3154753 RepID=UPI003420CC1C
MAGRFATVALLIGTVLGFGVAEYVFPAYLSPHRRSGVAGSLGVVEGVTVLLIVWRAGRARPCRRRRDHDAPVAPGACVSRSSEASVPRLSETWLSEVSAPLPLPDVPAAPRPSVAAVAEARAVPFVPGLAGTSAGPGAPVPPRAPALAPPPRGRAVVPGPDGEHRPRPVSPHPARRAAFRANVSRRHDAPKPPSAVPQRIAGGPDRA